MDRRLIHINKREEELRFNWRRFSAAVLILVCFAVAFWHYCRPATVYKTGIFNAILLFILYEAGQAGWFRGGSASGDKLLTAEDLRTLAIAIITISSVLIAMRIYFFISDMMSTEVAVTLAIASSIIMFVGGCWLLNMLRKAK